LIPIKYTLADSCIADTQSKMPSRALDVALSPGFRTEFTPLGLFGPSAVTVETQ
jgi:hypothetical protein